MKVIDAEKSEVGLQRRRSLDGRLVHCCCICGHVGVWTDGWAAFYSIKDIDAGASIPKFCSEECRTKGGFNASNVTADMLQKARQAEMREPNIMYRDATTQELYRSALDQQLSSKKVDQ